MRISLCVLALLATSACGVRIHRNEPYDGGFTPYDAGFRDSAPRTSSDASTRPVDAARADAAPIYRAQRPPPPIAGGTLLLLRDRRYAVATDPDRDAVYVIDVIAQQVMHRFTTGVGSVPWRAIEGSNGMVHVVARNSGEVLTINTSTRQLEHRVLACTMPRGIAYHTETQKLLVACAEGALVTLAGDGSAVETSRFVAEDLRDVVTVGNRVFVSRFRSAEVTEVRSDGSVHSLGAPPAQHGRTGTRTQFDEWTAGVAWRMIALGDNALLLQHQRMLATQAPALVSSMPVYYSGASCSAGGLLQSVTTEFPLDDVPSIAMPFAQTGLYVDLTASRDRRWIATVDASDSMGRVRVYDRTSTLANCLALPLAWEVATRGQATAAAFYDNGTRLLVQTREPAELHFVERAGVIRVLTLNEDSVKDTGHQLFHMASPSGIACASCHPEGEDDGHVWNFPVDGVRRTPPLLGGIARRAPFHWDGSLLNFAALTDEVWVRRMRQPALSDAQREALSTWLNSQTNPTRAPADENEQTAIARGEAVFRREDVGCASCHSGPQLTNNLVVDVGTGGRFKVPSLLGLARRAPYLHNGCAATLEARFTACGGDARHGRIDQLSAQERQDLLLFLRTR